MWTRVCGALALAAVGVALGCGGSGDDKDKEAAVASRECPAAPAAMSGQPTLPTGFPQPAEVTYTGQVAKGPTSVIKGYFAKDSFKDPFEVEDSEHEAVDAEIEFKGSGKEGQVKLLQKCKDRTTVTLTIRPQ